MTSNDDNNVDKHNHDDDNDDDAPFRSSLLARQDWGLGVDPVIMARERAKHKRTTIMTMIMTTIMTRKNDDDNDE